MTRAFPDAPPFQGIDRPTRLEADVYDLEIEGEVPHQIDGSFIRVQPDPMWPPFVADDITFNGDGLVAAFRIQDGHVSFRSRYARTAKFLAEQAARRALIGHYRNPFFDDPSVAGINRTTSNTQVFVHAGKLLALKEDGPPTAMDPVTLETLGEWRFDGGMTADTFTAHPKIDPLTGEMIAFGYEARGLGSDDIAYYVIDKAGKVTREVWLKAPHAAMIHDWGVTRNYVVFPVMPLVSDVEQMKAGKPRFRYRYDLEQYYGVMRRDGDGSDIRWFRAPNAFQGHTLNAFEEEGGKVHLDLCLADDNVFPFFPDETGHAPKPGQFKVAVTRMTFDLAANRDEAVSQVLSPVIGEFAHCDDRYSTLPYRYAFLAVIDPSKFELGGNRPRDIFFNAIGKLDVTTGHCEQWFAGPGSAVQEPVFAPRASDAPEGDGFVMAVVTRIAEQRSDLVILDTARIAAGPVAVARLPFRLRHQIHGNWVQAHDLAV